MNLKLLKQERVSQGITQQEMADKLGFRDKSSYCQIERGKIRCTVQSMNTIIDILRLSTDKAVQIFFDPKDRSDETNDFIS